MILTELNLSLLTLHSPLSIFAYGIDDSNIIRTKLKDMGDSTRVYYKMVKINVFIVSSTQI